MTPEQADATYGYLTTTGRVSGRPHRVEIWFAAVGDTLYLLSGSGGRSDWCRNLDATPGASFTIEDITMSVTARRVIDGAEDASARDAVFSKYRSRYSGDLIEWRERSVPFALDLHGSD